MRVRTGGEPPDLWIGTWGVDGAMHSQGHVVSREGDAVPFRMRFVPLAPDTVRQVLDTRRDGEARRENRLTGTCARR